MTRKIIAYILLVSFSLSFGCHNTSELSKDDLISTPTTDLKTKCEGFDVTVSTSNSGKYNFSKDNFRIHADTLTGFGTQYLNGNDVPFRGSIPLGDVRSIETKEFSPTKTILIIVIPAGIVTVLLFMWAAAMSEI